MDVRRQPLRNKTFCDKSDCGVSFLPSMLITLIRRLRPVSRGVDLRLSSERRRVCIEQITVCETVGVSICIIIYMSFFVLVRLSLSLYVRPCSFDSGKSPTHKPNTKTTIFYDEADRTNLHHHKFEQWASTNLTPNKCAQDARAHSATDCWLVLSCPLLVLLLCCSVSVLFLSSCCSLSFVSFLSRFLSCSVSRIACGILHVSLRVFVSLPTVVLFDGLVVLGSCLP